MHSVVLTKGVPDFREGQVSFDEDGHLERGATPTVMNPNDEFALEAALQTKVKHGGRVSVMSMGPPGYGSVLREAMEVYADDSYLLADREMAAADTWATAITLSAGIEKIGDTEERSSSSNRAEPDDVHQTTSDAAHQNPTDSEDADEQSPSSPATQSQDPDIVFAGFKTADGETGQTGPQTAWCLDRPIVTHVIALEVDEEAGRLRAKRLVEGDVDEIETVEAPLPAFVVPDPEFEPSYRRAEHRLRYKELKAETEERARNHEDHLTTWDHEALDLDSEFIGLDGSPTIVSGVDPIPKAPSEREATMVTPDDEEGMSEVLETMQPFAGGD